MDRYSAIVDQFRDRVNRLARFCEIYFDELGEVRMLELPSGGRGWRFDGPTKQHFCFLKISSAVSTFHACFDLIESGHVKEFCVLIRTVIEDCSHIDFVVSPYTDAKRVEKYVESYFSDWSRLAGISLAKAPRQKEIHDALGRHLDEAMEELGANVTDQPSSELMSHTYVTYSNYVHSRYVELADLVGGRPPRMHLNGMSGTPKDREMLEIYETFLTSLENTVRGAIIFLDLRNVIGKDRDLADWFGAWSVDKRD